MDISERLVQFDIDALYLEIEDLIVKSKIDLNKKINSTIICLYWKIGQNLYVNVLNEDKASYGESIITELSKRLFLV